MSGTEKSRKRPLKQSSADRSINIKIKGQDGVEVFFKTKRSIMLLKVLKVYCDKRNFEYKYMQFLCNGERFDVKRSPDDLNMGEEEDVEIDAMMIKDGGGGVGN